jgi:hypothetical protein
VERKLRFEGGYSKTNKKKGDKSGLKYDFGIVSSNKESDDSDRNK